MSERYEPVLVLGLMSGTSADGVDAALIRTDGESIIDFIGAATCPYDTALRTSLIEVAQRDIPIDCLLLLEKQMTDAHVEACKTVLRELNRNSEQLAAIGFHGHTVRHLPVQGITWQMGDAARLATKLGTTVVHDFRRADISLGGEGAPLAPLFHRELVKSLPKPTMVLNLGGVANITWIGRDDEIRAGDTGPGCGLLDAWTARHTNEPFDRDGRLSASGMVNEALVQAAIQHDYFRRPLPKSADRYEFDFVDVSALTPADGAATLCAITAAGVELAARQMPELPVTTWVTGGGARNPVLMQELRARLGDVRPVEDARLRADSMEAECFAWLAVRRLRNLPTSLPETTGCERPTSGGAVTRIQS